MTTESLLDISVTSDVTMPLSNVAAMSGDDPEAWGGTQLQICSSSRELES